jgi:hypothetical protein
MEWIIRKLILQKISFRCERRFPGKNKHLVYGRIPKELLPAGMKTKVVRIINSLYGEILVDIMV